MVARERTLLPRVWKDVPEIFRRRLGERAGRQRAMVAEGHLLLILHQPPAPDEDERIGRLYWRKPDGTWLTTESGSGDAALESHLDEYGKILERLDDQEETAQGASDYFEVVQSVAPVYRSARNMHRALQEAREQIPDERRLINFRDRAGALERTAELLSTDAKNGLEYAIAKRSEEQARSGHDMAVSAHRLNVLAAFFFPIATLSSVFGMNFAHGMESLAPPLPFLATLALGFVGGMVLKAAVTKKPPAGERR